jgi:hypothetical protein
VLRWWAVDTRPSAQTSKMEIIIRRRSSTLRSGREGEVALSKQACVYEFLMQRNLV